MNWLGIEAAVVTFICVALFHPIVIKSEYYFSARCWPVFLAAGLGCTAASLFVASSLLSITFGALGCCFLWSVIELKEQEQRVARGWAPKNPKRKYKFDETSEGER